MNNEHEDLRSPRNKFQGYIYHGRNRDELSMRVDFNARIAGSGNAPILEGFNLRLFASPDDHEVPEETRIETGVFMTVEQWQDLISAMQAELALARRLREDLQDPPSPCDEEP